jgi:hypothetical protein
LLITSGGRQVTMFRISSSSSILPRRPSMRQGSART